MERILIEIRGGNPVNIISTSWDISIEFLDYDWINDGGELVHTPNAPDEVMTNDELDNFIKEEIKKAEK